MSGDALLSEEGFRAFYESTAPRLLAYVRRLVGPDAGADEVVQEAYLRLLERRPAGLDETRGRAWVYTTASRLARERWRRRGLARRWAEAETSSGGESEAAGESRAHGLALDVERALRRLPVRERALLWLAYAEGRSHREIAPVLGLRPGSVRVLLFRARRRLERIFQEMGLTEEDER